MKKNKQSDFEYIKRQINHINNRIYALKIASSINHPLIKEFRDCKIIGESYFVDFENYKNTVDKILQDEKYFILLNDECVINIAYTFDANGTIVKHTLDFLSILDPMVYLRFDYSLNREENDKSNHQYPHMHTSMSKNTFRIPVSAPVTPFALLSIVLKYYFNDDGAFVDTLSDSKWASFHSAIKKDSPFLKL